MLIQANALAIPLRDTSVQCIVTSPPYWGLRDYGVPGQIGLEETPDAYLDTMRAVFRECWRVLKPDGVCFVNLGDCYNVVGRGEKANGLQIAARATKPRTAKGLKPKDLVGIPWRVAFALQADGWYLRSDIIWAKPNPMPESVTDRPTRSHEYVFLLTKQARYYWDTDAVREPSTWRYAGNGFNRPHRLSMGGRGDPTPWKSSSDARNLRSVWTIFTEPTPEAHFATFPEKLVEPCIKAGSRPGDLVFDPFVGSGTVGRVATRLSRRWVGTELSGEYLKLAKRRTAQRGLAMWRDV